MSLDKRFRKLPDGGLGVSPKHNNPPKIGGQGVDSSYISRLPKLAIFLAAAFAVIAADQLSKQWIRDNLLLGQSLPVEGFIRLTHVSNTGVAFGLLADRSFPLAISSIIVAAVIGLYYFFRPLDTFAGKAILGALLGGAIGNIIDRLRFGYVTDFIDVGPWPVFNVADSAVTVCIVLLIYTLLFSREMKKEPEGKARPGQGQA